MEYCKLTPPTLTRALFSHFVRRQVVSRCWRKGEDGWRIEEIAFTDDWDEAEYGQLIDCLCNTLRTGGLVLGAFTQGRLKGFCSVEAGLFGRDGEYLDLSSLHVSQDMRGRGIGRELLGRACVWAKAQGARKLYISAHSAVETQAFYRSMGCVEAQEYNEEHVRREPFDCQLELSL